MADGARQALQLEFLSVLVRGGAASETTSPFLEDMCQYLFGDKRGETGFRDLRLPV